ncbi:MAG TPA: type II secretion system F family protein [Chthoniobacterales bacterium]|nr:type II secretion system F family protein [Chthoniobacterales bacterium]
MRLSLLQKEQFFHELRELIRSGKSMHDALEMKATARSRAVRDAASAMLESAGDGSAENYFNGVPDLFSPLDREIVRGGAASGRLDETMGYLSEYYGMLYRMRRQIIMRTAYPVFMLHFAALMLAVPTLVTDGLEPFLVRMMLFLGSFYALFALCWLVYGAAARAANANAVIDQMIQALPAIGGTRVALVGSRFCMLMGILVKASGSILSAINRSAGASGSALFQRGAAQAVNAIQGGDGLGMAVMKTRAFPEAIDRAFQVGEASGRLDEEMQRQASRFAEQLNLRMEAISKWVPVAITVGVFIVIGVLIVLHYMSETQAMNSMMENM